MKGELKKMEKSYTSLLSYDVVYSFLYLMSFSNYKLEVSFVLKSCSPDDRRRRRREGAS
jgi:hypothetical protein